MNNTIVHKICIVVLLLFSISLTAQRKMITGLVTDMAGESLPGATIKLEGVNTINITDFDGKFNLEAPSDGILIISYLGYIQKKINIKGDNNFTIKLKEDVESLDEVVVVGYGTVKKSDLTGAVSSVKSEELLKSGAVSVDQALAGRASGVLVNQSSGMLGAAPSIRVRGLSSMQNSDPLYIIDGVPMDNNSSSTLNGDDEQSAQINPLSLINPADVTSIEVLKDASATAIYGSRGANGVVLITTRRGEIGKGTVEVSAESGVSFIQKYIDVMDANQFVLTRAEARWNSNGVSPDGQQSAIDSARAGLHPTEDWQKKLIRPAYSNNVNVSLSGGSKDLRYRLSTNVLDATGIVEKTDFKRATTRLNLNADISDRLKTSARVIYSSVQSSQQSTNTNFNASNGTNSVIMRSLTFSPSTLLTDVANDEELGIVTPTPLTFVDANSWNTDITQFIGSFSASYTLFKGATFKTLFSHQKRFSEQQFYQKNLQDSYPTLKAGWAKTKHATNTSSTITNTFDYRTKLSRKISFNGLLGQSYEKRIGDSYATSNYGFVNDVLGYFDPGSAEFQDPDEVSYKESTLLSFFGRLNLNVNQKFLFTLTGRYDGSSKFAKNNKWGFFPAGAFAYKLSKEKFMKNIDEISNLKLRLSYGIVGSQGLSEYSSLDRLASSQFTFGSESGENLSTVFYRSQLPNANLKWENTSQFNAGIDLGMFSNRLTVTADYFKKRTTDFLVPSNPVQSQSGFSTITTNFGIMDTNGFDLGVKYNVISKNKLSWVVNGNMSVGKSKIIKMDEDFILSGYANANITGGTQRLIVGEYLGAFYGFERAGIAQFDDFVEFDNMTREDQISLYNSDRTATYTYKNNYEGGLPWNGLNRPGEQLYKDNGDGVITEEDKKVIGIAQPDIVFGINNSFNISDFDFSFFIDSQLGQKITNLANTRLFSFTGNQQLAEVIETAWTPENPTNTNPRVDSSNSQTIFSDRYVEDGSFVRLQNVTLGYNLPKKTLKKLNINFLRFYVSGSNLLMLSDYSGFNPDVSLSGSNSLRLGHDNAGFPSAKTIRIGVNLKF